MDPAPSERREPRAGIIHGRERPEGGQARLGVRTARNFPNGFLYVRPPASSLFSHSLAAVTADFIIAVWREVLGTMHC